VQAVGLVGNGELWLHLICYRLGSSLTFLLTYALLPLRKVGEERNRLKVAQPLIVLILSRASLVGFVATFRTPLFFRWVETIRKYPFGGYVPPGRANRQVSLSH